MVSWFKGHCLRSLSAAALVGPTHADRICASSVSSPGSGQYDGYTGTILIDGFMFGSDLFSRQGTTLLGSAYRSVYTTLRRRLRDPRLSTREHESISISFWRTFDYQEGRRYGAEHGLFDRSPRTRYVFFR